MKNSISTVLLSAGLFFSAASFAQTEPSTAKKQEEPKKAALQDSTKKPGGTRMAINSQGLPTKGTKNNNSNSNRTVSDPKKDEGKPTTKSEPKK
jgi:hypothetical protein